MKGVNDCVGVVHTQDEEFFEALLRQDGVAGAAPVWLSDVVEELRAIEMTTQVEPTGALCTFLDDPSAVMLPTTETVDAAVMPATTGHGPAARLWTASGKLRRLSTRLAGLGLAGKLMLGAGVAMAATGTTIGLTHLPPIRPAAVVPPSGTITPSESSKHADPQTSTGPRSRSGHNRPADQGQNGQADQGQADQGQSPEPSPGQSDQPGAGQTSGPDAGNGGQPNDARPNDAQNGQPTPGPIGQPGDGQPQQPDHPASDQPTDVPAPDPHSPPADQPPADAQL